MDDCVFCKIIRGDFGTEFVAESAGAVAFNDIHPAAPVHVLVVPREHVSNLHTVTDPRVYAECLSLCAEVAALTGVQDSGYRVINNNGRGVGQTVFHLHFHVKGGQNLPKGES